MSFLLSEKKRKVREEQGSPSKKKKKNYNEGRGEQRDDLGERERLLSRYDHCLSHSLASYTAVAESPSPEVEREKS